VRPERSHLGGAFAYVGDTRDPAARADIEVAHLY
jgi:hypothetical protein